MNKLNRPVQGPGETSLRIHDLDAVRRFYEEVIGFEVLREEGNLIEFKSYDKSIQ
jgi:catechol-2,3-dioxygenase